MLIDDGFASTLPSFPEFIASRCKITLSTVQYFIVISSVCLETVFGVVMHVTGSLFNLV